MYRVKNPVLIRFFNRPNKIKKVMAILKKVKPKQLYLLADGPRPSKGKREKKLVEITRQIATEINWKCNVKKKFFKENLGGPKAGYEGICWFFNSVKQGIILEDDCIPNIDFFKFCDELLEYYKDDNRVGHITGNNFQNGNIRGDSSYYFSKYTHTWGWASWQRSVFNWNLVEKNWPKIKKKKLINNFYNDNNEKKYWEKIFDELNSCKNVHWDYSWMLKQWMNKSLTVTPNVNLVKNIGFGKDATHQVDKNSNLNSVTLQKLDKIIHPKEIKINIIADIYAFNFVFKEKIIGFPGNLIHLFKRILNFLKKNLIK